MFQKQIKKGKIQKRKNISSFISNMNIQKDK